MRNKLAAILVGILGFIWAGSALAALAFTPFVTSANINATLSNNQTIGFAYAGDKFVGSVYFGTNNNQLYQTNLSGGNVTKFGAPNFVTLPPDRLVW